MSFKTGTLCLWGVPVKQLAIPSPPGPIGLMRWCSGIFDFTRECEYDSAAVCCTITGLSFSWELFTRLDLPEIGMFYYAALWYCSCCIIFYLQFQFLELESLLPSVWAAAWAPCFPFSFGSACCPGGRPAPGAPRVLVLPCRELLLHSRLGRGSRTFPLLLSGIKPALLLTSDLEDLITAVVLLLSHGGII